MVTNDRRVPEGKVALWLAATRTRHSRRTFQTKPVEPRLLDELEETCADFRPHPDCRVRLVRAPATDVFRGIVGSYGRVTGAPHILVISASIDAPFSQQHAGYVGEGCILEATALGLHTCWVGGFFRQREVKRIVELGPRERVVAVSPVGHALGDRSRNERLMEQLAHAHKRKPIEAIATEWPDAWPSWARAAVECARIAPSATNRQPWRFRMSGDDLILCKTHGELPRVTKALDCGIAMLHAELGARGVGTTGTWHDIAEGQDVGRFTIDQEV